MVTPKVSILVFVDLAFEENYRTLEKSFLACVSILVFVDLAFEVWASCRDYDTGEAVSILVFVDLAFEATEGRPLLLVGSCVSILVFVDLAFEVDAARWLSQTSRRFNPCFRGSSFRSLHSESMGRLSWVSFNPCFRGSSFRSATPPRRSYHALQVSILVFVDLAFEVKGRSTCPLEPGFVSILVFVDLAFEVTPLSGFLALSFAVSILVFVDLAFEDLSQWLVDCSGHGFNPCFRGSSFRSFKSLLQQQHDYDVSILVFVDLAFEVPI